MKRANHEYQSRYAEAHRAQSAVQYAILTGRLVRPSICDKCGGEGAIEAAHRDYTKRLDVRWLCRPCHVRWDREQPKTSEGEVYHNAVRLGLTTWDELNAKDS